MTTSLPPALNHSVRIPNTLPNTLCTTFHPRLTPTPQQLRASTLQTRDLFSYHYIRRHYELAGEITQPCPNPTFTGNHSLTSLPTLTRFAVNTESLYRSQETSVFSIHTNSFRRYANKKNMSYGSINTLLSPRLTFSLRENLQIDVRMPVFVFFVSGIVNDPRNLAILNEKSKENVESRKFCCLTVIYCLSLTQNYLYYW